jgi:hypothetical protein
MLFVCVSRDFARTEKLPHTKSEIFKVKMAEHHMFLESAAASNYRIKLHRDDEVYLNEPCREQNVLLGRVFPVDDIRMKSDFKVCSAGSHRFSLVSDVSAVGIGHQSDHKTDRKTVRYLLNRTVQFDTSLHQVQ